jgi:excinuclease UvrABC nuclease subunit
MTFSAYRYDAFSWKKSYIFRAVSALIPGIGPARKRALLHHFGTLKEIERASLADLGKVPGVSAESARRIHDFFHPARS